MNILVIGTGGREHALCYKLAQSASVNKLYCTEGNASIEKIAELVPLQPLDLEGLANFAESNQIDITVVGPEAPLCMGISDVFKKRGLTIFGPDKISAQLEGSKDFAKAFMKKYCIPTANWDTAYSFEQAAALVENYSFPVVIKADGLCAGKGVFICESKEAALGTLDSIFIKKIFGDEGKKVILEEFLQGIEASQLCVVSKNNIFPLETARDYKKIGENDTGLNTGGVGCISPNPAVTNEVQKKISEILQKISAGLTAEKMNYTGILFIGFMIQEKDIRVLEFNVRFGDPETQVLMLRLKSDLGQILRKAIDGNLTQNDLEWSNKKAMAIVCTSKGYPEKYQTGFPISGLDSLPDSIIVFHSGTKKIQEKIITSGGRVLCISCIDSDFNLCRKTLLENIKKINFTGMKYRKDIGII